jgi:LytS/YehU family sensor histidine kinase
VCIRAQRRAERLAIEIENGVDPAPRRRDGGVGLANVRARLAAEYGTDALLRIETEAGHFKVVLDLPARTREATEAS